MRFKGWLILAIMIAAVLGLASCGLNDSDDLSDAERSEIATEIKQRNRDLLAVWAKEDAFDAWMELYADDDHPSWVDDRYLLTVSGANFGSQAEMGEAFRDVLVDRTTQVTTISESVAVLSADHAVHFAEFTWSLTRDGVTSEEYAATGTTVWTLVDGVWKILHYHQSWPSTSPVPVSE